MRYRRSRPRLCCLLATALSAPSTMHWTHHAVVLAVLMVAGGSRAAELPPQECPSECSCYYFRIHWVAECAYRGLAAAPAGLSPATYVLDLSGNRLDTLVLPAEVKPRKIILSNNFFRKLQRSHFQGLNLLLDVDLSGNQLNHVDPDVFRESPGLLSLQLQRNARLTGPSTDTAFLVSRSLQALDLADCGFTRIGAAFFSASPSLRKIDLSGNPLAVIEAGAFSSLSGLDELRLSRTQLASLSTAFAPEAPVRVLNLGGSRLDPSDLAPLLTRLKHVEELDLSENGMVLDTEQHVDAFEPAHWLQHLNLAHNRLSELDMTRALGKLRHLETLDLSYCSLNSNSFRGDTLSNLTRLRTLKLSGNPLSAHNMTALLETFSKLHTLTLRDCSLTTTGFLRELLPLRQSLRALDLAGNPLGDAEVNAAGSIFPHLESLDVSRCALTQLSDTAFSSATSLRNLAISGNPLTRLQRGALSNLTRLVHLHMEDCKLRGAPGPEVFPSPAPLKELRMAGNPLKPSSTPLVPQHLSGLTLLDVSRSGLKRLPSSAVRHANLLERLILADNLLEGEDALPANLGSLTPKLESLDLRRCKLRSLKPSLFAGSEQLSQVFLTGNPWSCDCELAGLWRWATSRGVALQEKGGVDTLRCADTEQTWAHTLDAQNCA